MKARNYELLMEWAQTPRRSLRIEAEHVWSIDGCEIKVWAYNYDTMTGVYLTDEIVDEMDGPMDVEALLAQKEMESKRQQLAQLMNELGVREPATV